MHRLGDDGADRHPRIERRERILKNHLHLPTKRTHAGVVQPVNSLALPPNFAPQFDRRSAAAEQVQHRPSSCRFAAARLADQAERFAGANLKADAIDGADETALAAKQMAVCKREVDMEVADIQKRRAD